LEFNALNGQTAGMLLYAPLPCLPPAQFTVRGCYKGGLSLTMSDCYAACAPAAAGSPTAGATPTQEIASSRAAHLLGPHDPPNPRCFMLTHPLTAAFRAASSCASSASLAAMAARAASPARAARSRSAASSASTCEARDSNSVSAYRWWPSQCRLTYRPRMLALCSCRYIPEIPKGCSKKGMVQLQVTQAMQHVNIA
jgi:hypothetical protein